MNPTEYANEAVASVHRSIMMAGATTEMVAQMPPPVIDLPSNMGWGEAEIDEFMAAARAACSDRGFAPPAFQFRTED